MPSISSALMAGLTAGTRDNWAHVKSITDALNASGLKGGDDVASEAFFRLAEGDLAALNLSIKQKATVRAAQDAARRTLGGGYH